MERVTRDDITIEAERPRKTHRRMKSNPFAFSKKDKAAKQRRNRSSSSSIMAMDTRDISAGGSSAGVHLHLPSLSGLPNNEDRGRGHTPPASPREHLTPSEKAASSPRAPQARTAYPAASSALLTSAPTLNVLRLTYFHRRGRAEQIRLFMAVTNTPYEDVYVDIAGFAALRNSKNSILAFGTVPVLSDGDFHLSQTTAIMYYLAKKTRALLPADDIELAKCMMTAAGVEDFKAATTPLLSAILNNQPTEEHLEYFASVTAPRYLANFETLLRRNKGGNGFFVGESMTYCDLSVFAALNMAVRFHEECLHPFSKLSNFRERISAHPRIKMYHKSDRYLRDARF